MFCFRHDSCFMNDGRRSREGQLLKSVSLPYSVVMAALDGRDAKSGFACSPHLQKAGVSFRQRLAMTRRR